MLTVMCPNCRHRFPAPGCCNSSATPSDASGTNNAITSTTTTTTTTILNFDQPPHSSSLPTISSAASKSIGHSSGGLLLVDAYNQQNRQQQVHQHQVTISTQCGIQSGGCLIQSSNAEVLLQHSNSAAPPRLELRSKMSGGGCLVQKRIEPVDYYHHEQSNGGLGGNSGDAGADALREQCRPLLISEEQLRRSFEQAAEFHRSHSTTARLEPPPSGCQELPGTRRDVPTFNGAGPNSTSSVSDQQRCFGPQHPQSPPQAQQAANSCECRCCCYCRCCYTYCRNSNGAGNNKSCCAADEPSCRRSLCQVAANNGGDLASSRSGCCSRSKDGEDHREARAGPRVDHRNASVAADSSKYSGDVRIQVNATVHLPCVPSSSSSSAAASTLGSCTLNITASTSTSSTSSCGSNLLPDPNPNNGNRLRNNFNGGGIVTLDNSIPSIPTISNNNPSSNNIGNVSRDETPVTPVSWLTPCPWAFDPSSGGGYLPEKDVVRLAEVRRVLQSCGWYHEGLSWQQSENLLKEAPVGRWLMRDSSDTRYTFAISVQTARGPTSVRVFYFMGKFRLDAEPRLAFAMPLFECPIKMLEYYCEYSKRMDEHRQEVWVDYSGQVYSQIYLSEPLVKEVRSLSHLARIAVNKAGASIENERDKLPPLIKNYLKEYPYTL